MLSGRTSSAVKEQYFIILVFATLVFLNKLSSGY